MDLEVLVQLQEPRTQVITHGCAALRSVMAPLSKSVL
jgi:hypothetical protein